MEHVAYHSECRREKTEGIYHMFWHRFVGNASYVFANVLSTQKIGGNSWKSIRIVCALTPELSEIDAKVKDSMIHWCSASFILSLSIVIVNYAFARSSLNGTRIFHFHTNSRRLAFVAFTHNQGTRWSKFSVYLDVTSNVHTNNSKNVAR